MKKLIYGLVFMLVTLAACENAQVKTEAASQEAVVEEIVVIDIPDFDSLAEQYIGKQIQLAGTVDHICKHGGQRAFLVSPESEARIKITPDEHIAAFNTNMEGNVVIITGVVEEQRIDEAYIMDWEQEVKSGVVAQDDKGEGSHLGGQLEKGGEGADISEEMQKIENLRQTLKDSGKAYLSFFSVLCTSIEVVDQPAEN